MWNGNGTQYKGCLQTSLCNMSHYTSTPFYILPLVHFHVFSLFPLEMAKKTIPVSKALFLIAAVVLFGHHHKVMGIINIISHKFVTFPWYFGHVQFEGWQKHGSMLCTSAPWCNHQALTVAMHIAWITWTRIHNLRGLLPSALLRGSSWFTLQVFVADMMALCHHFHSQMWHMKLFVSGVSHEGKLMV